MSVSLFVLSLNLRQFTGFHKGKLVHESIGTIFFEIRRPVFFFPPHIFVGLGTGIILNSGLILFKRFTVPLAQDAFLGLSGTSCFRTLLLPIERRVLSISLPRVTLLDL